MAYRQPGEYATNMAYPQYTSGGVTTFSSGGVITSQAAQPAPTFTSQGATINSQRVYTNVVPQQVPYAQSVAQVMGEQYATLPAERVVSDYRFTSVAQETNPVQEYTNIIPGQATVMVEDDSPGGYNLITPAQAVVAEETVPLPEQYRVTEQPMIYTNAPAIITEQVIYTDPPGTDVGLSQRMSFAESSREKLEKMASDLSRRLDEVESSRVADEVLNQSLTEADIARKELESLAATLERKIADLERQAVDGKTGARSINSSHEVARGELEESAKLLQERISTLEKALESNVSDYSLEKVEKRHEDIERLYGAMCQKLEILEQDGLRDTKTVSHLEGRLLAMEGQGLVTPSTADSLGDFPELQRLQEYSVMLADRISKLELGGTVTIEAPTMPANSIFLSEHESIVLGHTNNVSMLRSKILQLEESETMLKTKCRELEVELQAMRQQVPGEPMVPVAEYERVMGEKAQMEKAVQSFTEDLLPKMSSGHEVAMQEKFREIHELRILLEQTQAEKNLAAQELQSSLVQKQEAEDACAMAKEDLARAQAALNAAEAQILNLRSDLGSSGQNQAELQRLNNALAVMEQEKRQIGGDLDALDAEHRANYQALHDQHSNLLAQQAMYDQSLAEFEALKAQHATMKGAHEQELFKRLQSHQDLNSKLESEQKLRREREESIRMLQSQKPQVPYEELQYMEAEKLQYKQQLDVEVANIARLQTEMADLNAEIDMFKQINSSQAKTIHQLSSKAEPPKSSKVALPVQEVAIPATRVVQEPYTSLRPAPIVERDVLLRSNPPMPSNVGLRAAQAPTTLRPAARPANLAGGATGMRVTEIDRVNTAGQVVERDFINAAGQVVERDFRQPGSASVFGQGIQRTGLLSNPAKATTPVLTPTSAAAARRPSAQSRFVEVNRATIPSFDSKRQK
jgi:hypothetical protein